MKIDQNYIQILQFVSNLKLEDFCSFIDNISTDYKRVVRDIISNIKPEINKDILSKANLDLKELTISELIQLAYYENINPEEKIFDLYYLLIKNFTLIPNEIYVQNKENIKINNSGDVFEVMRKILFRLNEFDKEREHLWVMNLGAYNKIISVELVSKGTKEYVIAEAKEVFSSAIKNKANKIILVHNHPENRLEPSSEDIKITEKLVKTGELIGIPVKDHLIVSQRTYYSFETHGLLAKKKLKDNGITQINLMEEVLNNIKMVLMS